MAKHRVYVREHLEPALQQEASRRGVEPAAVLSSRVNVMLEGIADNYKPESILAKIAALEERIEALFSLVEIAAVYVGHVSGVMRASTKNNEPLAQAGAQYEASVREQATALKGRVKATY